MAYLEDKATASYGLDYAPGEGAPEETEPATPASNGVGAKIVGAARAFWGAWVRYSVLDSEYGRQWPY